MLTERFFNMSVTARAACALFLLYIGLAGFTTTSTVPGRLVLFEGPYTLLIFAGTLACAFIVAVEVLVNTVLPDRYSWEWIKTRRWQVYLIGSGLSLLPSYYISSKFGISYAGAALYAGVPLVIVHLALCDIYAIYKAQRHEPKT